MVSWQNGFMHLSLKQGDMGSNPIGSTIILRQIGLPVIFGFVVCEGFVTDLL